MQMTRRGALALIGAGGSLTWSKTGIEQTIIQRHDESVDRALRLQITDSASRGYGSMPNLSEDGKDIGIYSARSAASLLEIFTAAYLQDGSRFHHDPLLVDRMKLAATYLTRAQHEDGLIDFLDTNFDSAPDTGFTVWSVATAACLAQRQAQRELVALSESFLRKAAHGLTIGGVHTPNHRWVISSALAQIHELFPDPSYVRRIDQWLAEGIDIDADGQYTERSTTVYNPVCDRALLVIGVKLNRSALLDPIRQNLQSMLYILHSDFEVVTEISRRQDRSTHGNMGGYWFPLRYLAVRDGNGQYAALANHYTEIAASLPALMEYPEMIGPLPTPVAPPDSYAKVMNELGIVRFRRGDISSTLLANDPIFFTTRKGGVVVEAIRFASAFFGKGQFTAPQIEKTGDSYVLKQRLKASYYQPFEPPRRITSDTWTQSWGERKETQVCSLEQCMEFREMPQGFRIRMAANGTANVPVALEVNFRDGGTLEGCESAGPNVQLLSQGYATYSTADASLRFGPGSCKHRWTQIRGALPRLPGRSVYLTGFTPFEHTLDLDWI